MKPKVGDEKEMKPGAYFPTADWSAEAAINKHGRDTERPEIIARPKC